MKSPEGKERIEGGYARVATAALRVSERKERMPAPVPVPVPESPRESGSPKKRQRDGDGTNPTTTDESGEGLPPAADEPGMASSSSRIPPGTIGQGETQSGSRGRKRESDGDDMARDELVREDDLPDPAAATSSDAPMQPESSAHPPSTTRSSSAAETRDIGNLEQRQRLVHMEVVRRRFGCKSDLSEVYSPPRIVTVAEAAGLRGGFSLDLTARGPDGHAWDFTKWSCRRRALELVQQQRPYLLIGSPPCTASAISKT